MIAVDAEADGRRGRVFAREGAAVPVADASRMLEQSFTDEDAARAEQLRIALAQPVVFAVAHPGIEPDDVMHVYVRNAEPALFACVVITTSRLRKMLHEAPLVIENLDLQVAPTERLTVPALEAAVQAWAERNFPGLCTRTLVVEPWVDPQAVDLVQWLVEAETGQIGDPVTGEPDMSIAQPPLTEAA